ncbi:TRAP transporter small permease subunit, partial [Synergistaceae bacterium OttesenSCG-928-I11]|nr:TRAP transporter small permease subunit [Synergistaceae bacterium OttesenSCG-928-I11]
LKGPIRKAINVFGTILECVTLCGMVYFSILLVTETYETGQITPSTDYPMYLPYLVVAVGIVFCAIRSFQAVRKAFTEEA